MYDPLLIFSCPFCLTPFTFYGSRHSSRERAIGHTGAWLQVKLDTCISYLLAAHSLAIFYLFQANSRRHSRGGWLSFWRQCSSVSDSGEWCCAQSANTSLPVLDMVASIQRCEDAIHVYLAARHEPEEEPEFTGKGKEKGQVNRRTDTSHDATFYGMHDQSIDDGVYESHLVDSEATGVQCEAKGSGDYEIACQGSNTLQTHDGLGGVYKIETSYLKTFDSFGYACSHRRDRQDENKLSNPGTPLYILIQRPDAMRKETLHDERDQVYEQKLRRALPDHNLKVIGVSEVLNQEPPRGVLEEVQLHGLNNT